MKRFIFEILTLVTLTALPVYSFKLSAQDTIPVPILDDNEMIDLKFDENLDSLLNLYYVEQSLASDPEFWNNAMDTLVPEFTDAVYIDRLKKIPSVVDLTYNSVVRRYIEVYTKQKRPNVGVMLGLITVLFPIVR